MSEQQRLYEATRRIAGDLDRLLGGDALTEIIAAGSNWNSPHAGEQIQKALQIARSVCDDVAHLLIADG